jgi:uncharacterized membrane protein
MNDQTKPGTTFKDTPNAIRISTRLEKNWMQLPVAILSVLTLISIIFLFIVEVIKMVVQGVTPNGTFSYFLLFLTFGLVILGLYTGSKQAVDNAFLQEDVEITKTSITIVKTGLLMFRKKKVLPAERIKWIQLTIQLSVDGSKLVDFLMNTSKIGKLSIATRQLIAPNYLICRGISPDEAINALDKIHVKYPQYC